MTKAEIKHDRISVGLLVSSDLENEGLYRMINAHSDMNTCCQWIVQNNQEILNAFPGHRVDVAVLMVPWPILGDLLKRIHQKFPDLVSIVISQSPFHWSGILQMLEYGVVGLTRSTQSAVIVSMIRLAYYQMGSIDIDMARRMASVLPKSRCTRTRTLTQLDYYIWSLMVRGYSNPQIAQHCGITLSRTKHRIHHIFRYLGVRDRASAIAMYNTYQAFNAGLERGVGLVDHIDE
ncbi:helix-turn-helix transcriptional regulator [Sulfobacillus thermosulfidooxidans]|uniref:helix-turn-helix transcriptional regulator n=1 Tax=Sulfobacillus thermosulfidooxidans TaxID=28034 RepID=UPI0006B59B19|nr:response regulator transcription factor [Sulfobacillus thermosulfidooxidans]